jgi:hypothetical protein
MGEPACRDCARTIIQRRDAESAEEAQSLCHGDVVVEGGCRFDAEARSGGERRGERTPENIKT